MDKAKDLAEQHILESASRLRHIDELMTRAHAVVSEEEAATPSEALLRQVEADRNRLAQALEDLRRMPLGEGSDIVQRGEGLKGLLEALGRQLEQALGSVLERGK